MVSGSYTFSKTLFAGKKSDTKIQIDDPDFWKKVFVDSKSEAKLLME